MFKSVYRVLHTVSHTHTHTCCICWLQQNPVQNHLTHSRQQFKLNTKPFCNPFYLTSSQCDLSTGSRHSRRTKNTAWNRGMLAVHIVWRKCHLMKVVEKSKLSSYSCTNKLVIASFNFFFLSNNTVNIRVNLQSVFLVSLRYYYSFI